MRLWHVDLVPYLPRLQLLGQHRECCALRGKGWGKKHSTVNYVFQYPYEFLFLYHTKVLNEMNFRGYHPNNKWFDPYYRGKNSQELKSWEYPEKLPLNKKYPEHNAEYLIECIENLQSKIVKANKQNVLDRKYPPSELLLLDGGIIYLLKVYRLNSEKTVYSLL